MKPLLQWWRRIRLRLTPGKRASDLRWWERQGRRLGPRAVLHFGHTEEEMAAVTEWQRGILFPLLARQLRGDERLALDFGCGPGRFTRGLADLLGGRAVGVDPTQALLDLAPQADSVEYKLLENSRIPMEDESVDVAWICLVLMCITEERALQRSAAEIHRVLRKDGLVFLVENTQQRGDLPHLRYRSVEDYRSLLSFADLEHVGDYYDLGERISILAGRKRSGGVNGK